MKKSISLIALFLTGYLQCRSEHVGRIKKDSAPFFSNSFYKPYEHEHPESESLYQQTQEELEPDSLMIDMEDEE